MFERRFDNQGEYIYVKSNEIAKLEDMLNGLDFLQKETSLPRKIRLLEEASDVITSFTTADICLLIEKINETIPFYDQIKHAVVHSLPKNTAYALLLAHQISSGRYQLRVFSELGNAIDWLSEP
jgi:hypothetical protein